MEIHTDILNNINTKYVLLKQREEYIIIDKNRRTMVIIDDPLINFQFLINTMIENGVKIYNNVKELPKAEEFLIKEDSFPPAYKLFIKKIYDKNANETGAIISALTNKRIDKLEKQNIENRIKNYAFTVLYPREGLNIYSDVNSDTASITAIKGINNLPYQDIDSGEQSDLYEW